MKIVHRRIVGILVLGVAAVPTTAKAWNALGHKVIADIAWQQLEPSERKRIVDDLRRHPRFGEDFAQRVTADVTDDGRWIFQHAATWPDIARNIRGDDRKWDRATWHYVNLPLFLNGKRELTVNTSMEYPSVLEYNVGQATKHCLAVLRESQSGPERALAYCWLLHLVGDMHQPMHSTALFCDYFPKGDRGGNEIPLARGRNLHSLWDNLLGRQSRMRDVQREITELQRNRELWNVDTKPDIKGWIGESHELAKSVAYDPTILQAVRETRPGTELRPILLPESYMQEAGRVARQRIVAAGLRLGALLQKN